MLSADQRAMLAARLRRGRGEDAAGRIPRRPADMASPPASFGQEQLWFLDRLAPGQAVYNVPVVIRLRGPLDAAALGRAVDGLVARHEVLRTRLVANSRSRLVQVIDPPSTSVLGRVDLSGLDPGTRQARLRELFSTEAARPFSLAEGPVLRTWLLRVASDEHLLLVVVHHAVFDGWSAGVLRRDLAALYQAEATGAASGLADLPVQFGDYAVWERSRTQGPVLAELEAYWRTAMDGFEMIRFPTDRPRPAVDSFDGGLASRMTGRELLNALRKLSRREGTTLFVTMMAALQTLLHRYTGQTDLVVGTVGANRSRSALAPLIGYLVSTLPIRGDLSGNPAFTQVLAQLKETMVGAFAHQDLPFGKLVEALRVERDPSRAPVFQIALAYAEHDAAPVSAAGVEFTATDLIAGINAAKFDLTLAVEARDAGLWIQCSYKTALFDAATIRRLLGHFEVLLGGVAANPSARLSELPLLTSQELHAELAEWNDTAAALPVTCPHQAFEAQVTATPDAVAAEFGDERVSYAELNRWANRIARRLRDLGAGPEVLVGVCMAASLRRLATLLGIWKAGGGYVPLDPALPPGRLSFMMADTQMAVVVTDRASAAHVPARDGVTVISLDAEWEQLAALAGADLAGTGVAPVNVAYVLYTSGSTGQPKGVAVEHRQVVNFVRGMISNFRIAPPDVTLGFSAFTFDMSVLDMFTPLLAGARVVLADKETLHSPQRLAALMRRAAVTCACLPPAVLSLLGDGQFGSLRLLVVGGEELPPDLARRWARPGLRFVNGYGPTETTVMVTFQELAADAGAVPIGLPMPNCRAYVLDGRLNPVPVGVPGELHIGGGCVARGYLNRPGLTAQRFIPDPFTPGQRLYKTGDLVRRQPDGALVFVGRIDHQVKVRGLRIELGEVEAALAAHPAIAKAVVTVVTSQAGEKQLAAYLRAEPGTRPSAAELRAHLTRTLPAVMIPAHLIMVESFPLTSSGKVDHAALPPPGPQGAGGEAVPVTATERMIARLYATLLNVGRVGSCDSFFDLGGSSLQVMRLVDMINAETGVDVGVTTVFLHPTPRRLARRVDAISSGVADAAEAEPLIALSEGRGELPLYLIHPVGGTVAAYAPLARELAGTFKVYGLQSPWLTGGGVTLASLDALASDYTRRIRAAQPAGPYRLAGWSMGGVLAFEIARRLEQSGADVTLLALLDAPFSFPENYLPPLPQLAGRFLADTARSLGWAANDLPDPATATAAEQIAWLAAHLCADGDDSGARDALAARLRRRFEVFRAHSRMLAGYHPRTGVRAPLMIVSADGSPNAPARAHWPEVAAGPVFTLRVDGDHYAFLRLPLVMHVSAAILKWHGDSADGCGHDLSRGAVRVVDGLANPTPWSQQDGPPTREAASC